MMPSISNRIILSFFFFILLFSYAYSQSIPQGFNYQTRINNASGLSIINQSVSIRFSIYSNSATGTLIWQEDHAALTDNYGQINKIIGTGISTGAGISSSFSQINWTNAFYYLKVSIDILGGSSFADMGTSQLFSVPYSLYSSKTGSTNSLSLGQLNDVELSGNASNKLLKWNGAYWMSAVDKNSDTALYAVNALHSIYSDTSYYVYGTLVVDTILFAYQTDSSAFSTNAVNAFNTNSSGHSDTATYAFFSPPTSWKTNGNTLSTSSNCFGTNDNINAVFITNNLLRASIKSTGKLNIGNSSSNACLGVLGDDGLLSVGNFGSTYNPVAGAGTKMLWYPSKGAFRAGSVSSNHWDTIRVGSYSMSLGYNCTSRTSSFSSGFQSQSVDYSIAIGRNCQANPRGAYPNGNSITLGDSCIAHSIRAVVIGKNNVSDTTTVNTCSSAVAIGANNNTKGVVSDCLGSYCYTGAAYAVAIGYHARAANVGCFVFSDASSSVATNSTVNYQFLIRASGGVIFYTDSLNTMGVALYAGSGSWATVSDVNKKENFTTLNYESILDNIDKLKIKSWNYKSQSKSIRHIGPMAQDFFSVFGYGENNITISSVDVDGVILSGIRGLSDRLTNLQTINSIDSLKFRIGNIDNSINLNNRLDAIEAAINKK